MQIAPVLRDPLQLLAHEEGLAPAKLSESQLESCTIHRLPQLNACGQTSIGTVCVATSWRCNSTGPPGMASPRQEISFEVLHALCTGALNDQGMLSWFFAKQTGNHRVRWYCDQYVPQCRRVWKHGSLGLMAAALF